MPNPLVLLFVIATVFLTSMTAAFAAQTQPTPVRPVLPTFRFILDPELERKLPPAALKRARSCLTLPTPIECEACVRKAIQGVKLSKISGSPQPASDVRGLDSPPELAWSTACGSGI